jgi:hypothetical protein
MCLKRYLIYQHTGPESSALIGRVWACDQDMPFAYDLEWQRSPWGGSLYTIVEERHISRDATQAMPRGRTPRVLGQREAS